MSIIDYFFKANLIHGVQNISEKIEKMTLPEIIRPTLVVDKTICQVNIKRMAVRVNDNNFRFRLYFKTH